MRLHILQNKVSIDTLQIINNEPKNTTVLICDEACYLLNEHAECFNNIAKVHKLYCLDKDILARGQLFSGPNIAESISMQQFVKLTEIHNEIICW